MKEDWVAPFNLYFSGRGHAKDRSYYNNVRNTVGPRRLLFKHTLSGYGTLYAKRKKFKLKKGDLFVIERPGPYIYCFEDGPEPWHFEFVGISFTSPKGILPKSFAEDPVFSIADSPDFQKKLKKLINFKNQPEVHQNYSQSILSYQLVVNYIQMRTRGKSILPKPVISLRKKLYENQHRDCHIKSFCTELGYTQEALTRLYTQSFGYTPGQYLQKVRIQKALTMMDESKWSVKEIAHLCGFDSQNYFGRVFKKIFGVSPGKYKRNPNPLLFEEHLHY